MTFEKLCIYVMYAVFAGLVIMSVVTVGAILWSLFQWWSILVAVVLIMAFLGFVFANEGVKR